MQRNACQQVHRDMAEPVARVSPPDSIRAPPPNPYHMLCDGYGRCGRVMGTAGATSTPRVRELWPAWRVERCAGRAIARTAVIASVPVRWEPWPTRRGPVGRVQCAKLELRRHSRGGPRKVVSLVLLGHPKWRDHRLAQQ